MRIKTVAAVIGILGLVLAISLAPMAAASGGSGQGAGQASNRPASKKIIRKIEYAKADGKPLLLDLSIPEPATGLLPLIVWIPGGAWSEGRMRRTYSVSYMTLRGYAVACINYRLTQEAKFPAQIHDCKAAVRWLRAHAKEYNLDPNRIGVWGASGGGHLAALLGTSGGVQELEGDLGNLDQSSRVQAVCNWSGPTDFLQMAAHSGPNPKIDHNAPDSPESQLVGGPIQDNKDLVAKANPITYVSKDDPPFLIMHGDKDDLVPHHQSVILAEALRRAGVDATFYTVPKGGHGYELGVGNNENMAIDFFNRVLKNAPAPQPQKQPPRKR